MSPDQQVSNSDVRSKRSSGDPPVHRRPLCPTAMGLQFARRLSRLVDRHGARRYVVAAQVLAALGFVLFAASPALFANPYNGFMLATVIFSSSGGLLELLLSPIVNAIPGDEKASAMSLLHSFYSWGQLSVVLITTLLLLWWGSQSWIKIMLLWTILPIINTWFFARVPLAPTVPEEHRTPLKSLLTSRFFLLVVIGIGLGGASELVIAQWTSTFMEKALSLPKVVGDVAGVCTFALMMGVGRVLYGKFGSRINIYTVMAGGSLLATACYLVVIFSPYPLLSLVACALCGFAVSLLWPGSVSIAANHFPLAGASMFALLAAGGDTGASIGPWMVGLIADRVPAFSSGILMSMSAEQLGLRAGLLAATVFPLAMFFCVIWLKGRKQSEILLASAAQPGD